jgi:hypothetical protein
MGQTVMACQTYKCRGPYGPTFSEKTPGGGAGWHPGKLGHKLRGDNIAYFLLKIFEEALDSILSSTTGCNATESGRLRRLGEESTVATSTVVTSGGHPHEMANSLLATSMKFMHDHIDKSPLYKAPVACLPEECSSDAQCFTDYLPRESANTITSRIHNFSYDSQLELHGLDKAISANSVDLRATLANWTFELSFFDAAAVQKSEDRHMGYLDRKYIFVSQGHGTHISFLVSVVSKMSPIWLCECQKGFLKYPGTMTDLDRGALVILQPYPIQGESSKRAWLSVG